MNADLTRGFDMPTSDPQMDSDSSRENITDLLQSSPAWDDNMAFELLCVARQYTCVRSALMFSLELASPCAAKLRTAETMDEVRLLQGRIMALEQFATTLITILAQAEKPRETADELEN